MKKKLALYILASKLVMAKAAITYYSINSKVVKQGLLLITIRVKSLALMTAIMTYIKRIVPCISNAGGGLMGVM